MTRKYQIACSIGIIICGGILNAIAWTIAGPHPTNTIFLISGMIGYVIGLIWLVVLLNRFGLIFNLKKNNN